MTFEVEHTKSRSSNHDVCDIGPGVVNLVGLVSFVISPYRVRTGFVLSLVVMGRCWSSNFRVGVRKHCGSWLLIEARSSLSGHLQSLLVTAVRSATSCLRLLASRDHRMTTLFLRAAATGKGINPSAVWCF